MNIVGKAEKNVPEAPEAKAPEAPEAVKKEEPGVYVCEGCAVTSQRGILGAGEALRKGDLTGDEDKAITTLVDKGVCRVVR